MIGMRTENLSNNLSGISIPASWLSILAAIVALIFLASLHILSPEYDPSFRMVSEYANGHYPFILILMFISWAISSWALAFAIRSQLKTRAGKLGLIFLIIAGIGEAMGGIFNINHDILHGIAGALGIFGLPVAAILISVNITRNQAWLASRKALLMAANFTWIIIVLLIISFAVMIAEVMQSGVTVNPKAPVLPPGVIALVGWADRLLIVIYCLWVMMTAWKAIKLKKQQINDTI